jgi:hypothetical protein
MVLISVRGYVNSHAVMRLEELGKFKYPKALSGSETATLRLAAEIFDHLFSSVPPELHI